MRRKGLIITAADNAEFILGVDYISIKRIGLKVHRVPGSDLSNAH